MRRIMKSLIEKKWSQKTATGDMRGAEFIGLDRFEYKDETILDEIYGPFGQIYENHVYLEIIQMKKSFNKFGLLIQLRDINLYNSICKMAKERGILNDLECRGDKGICHWLIIASDAESIALFYQIINIQFPIEKNTQEIIFKKLNIKAIPNEAEFYISLEELIKNNELDNAFKKVASYLDADEHIRFRFGQLLETNGHYAEALDVVQDIPSTNPHFQMANKLAADILFLYDNPAKSDAVLSLNESKKNLENKVRFMLRANMPDEQNLLDRRFAELSHDKGIVPVIQNVKIDEDTIIKLATEIAALRQMNALLHQQNLIIEKEPLIPFIANNSCSFFSECDVQPVNELTQHISSFSK